MRSVLILVLFWLILQFGGLLFEGNRPRDPAGGAPTLTAERVENVLGAWPSRSRHLAKRVISDCGMPDGAYPNVLWWDHPGEVSIVIYREEIPSRSDSPFEASAAAVSAVSRARPRARERDPGKPPRAGF